MCIVLVVLLVWVAAIALFFNRWGKIRMLLPYQPDYKEQLKAAAAVSSVPPPAHVPGQPCSQVRRTLVISLTSCSRSILHLNINPPKPCNTAAERKLPCSWRIIICLSFLIFQSTSFSNQMRNFIGKFCQLNLNKCYLNYMISASSFV